MKNIFIFGCFFGAVVANADSGDYEYEYRCLEKLTKNQSIDTPSTLLERGTLLFYFENGPDIGIRKGSGSNSVVMQVEKNQIKFYQIKMNRSGQAEMMLHDGAGRLPLLFNSKQKPYFRELGAWKRWVPTVLGGAPNRPESVVDGGSLKTPSEDLIKGLVLKSANKAPDSTPEECRRLPYVAKFLPKDASQAQPIVDDSSGIQIGQ